MSGGFKIDHVFRDDGGEWLYDETDLVTAMTARGAKTWVFEQAKITFGSGTDIVSVLPMDGTTPILQGATSTRRPSLVTVDSDPTAFFDIAALDAMYAPSFSPDLNSSFSFVVWHKINNLPSNVQALMASSEDGNNRACLWHWNLTQELRFTYGALGAAKIPINSYTGWHCTIGSWDLPNLTAQVIHDFVPGVPAAGVSGEGMASAPVLCVGATSTGGAANQFSGNMLAAQFWPGIPLASAANVADLALVRKYSDAISGV